MLEERDSQKARATLMFVLLPFIYCVGMWMYFNWAVQGSPFWFLVNGQQLATVQGTAETIGGPDGLKTITRMDALRTLGQVHLYFAPALVVLAAIAGWLVIARRHWFAAIVVTFVASNLITSAAIVTLNGNAWMTQLRFNMRSIPVVIIGGAWLLRELHRAGFRVTYHVAMLTWLATLLGGWVGAVWLMENAKVQFTEVSFLRAVTTGDVLTGETDKGGQVLGCKPARKMGEYIDRNIHGRDVILADDSSSFAPMLYSGHPERFLDRVDRGDAYFLDQVNKPTKRVKYVLVAGNAICSGVAGDLITDRYPTLYEDGATEMPLVYEAGGYRLYETVRGGIMPKWTKAEELRALAEGDPR
jgi:hypothetical protein